MMRRSKKFSKADLQIWDHVRQSISPLSKKRELAFMRDFEDFEAHQPIDLAPLSAQISRNNTPSARSKIQLNSRIAAPLANAQGMQKSTKRAIARGRIEPEARLDLHGLRLDPAKIRFMHFIEQAAKAGHRSVLVVTGKGGTRRAHDFGFELTGVIRRALPGWLESPQLRGLVSHYCPAHIKHGGEGAWYIFIRAAARR